MLSDFTQRFVWTCLFTAMVVAVALYSPNLFARKSADGALRKMDRDGDGQLSRQEWRKNKIFDQVDLDSDGFLDRGELETRFGERNDDAARRGERPDGATIKALLRNRNGGVEEARKRGLFETGLYPVWPLDTECRGIDHGYAMDYRQFRGREAYHGGIDIPAPYDVPVVAAMSGEVIALYRGEHTPRGIEIVLRHTPEDSGLPMVVYSRYTHFRELPKFKQGQRVRLGEVLGSTGNTGYQRCQQEFSGCGGHARRSLLHFDILYSQDEKHYDTGTTIIPFEGRYMDPNALYRNKPPFDSKSMRDLPEADKAVHISYRLDTGEFIPPDTKRIWPYACWKK